MGTSWSVQPKGLAHWRQSVLIRYTRVVAHGQTCVPYTLSAPPPPPQPPPPQPPPDGDLVALVQYMIQGRGRDTVRVTKVEGNATDDDVEHGRVRIADKVGNAEADAAADLGRRHQSEILMDAWRKLLKVRHHWYPILLQLQRFMIAVARVTGTALIHLYGMWVVERRRTGRTSGLMLILLLYLDLLPS